MKDPRTPRLDDPNAERARRQIAASIRDLQAIPSANELILSDVLLVDSVVTPVPHGLGVAPKFVHVSSPRGAIASAGRIEEIRLPSTDRTKAVLLKATGWGATVTVDVSVK